MKFEIADDEILPHALWIVLVKYGAGWRCQECGAEPAGRARSLHAHHVDVDPANHRLSNGRALCCVCHTDAHNALRTDGPPRRRPGRPAVDKAAMAAQVAQLLAQDPEIRAGQVAARVRGRRSDVLRLVRVMRD